jgi:hypothetical protein
MIYGGLIVDLLCAEANNVAILLFLVVACLMKVTLPLSCVIAYSVS